MPIINLSGAEAIKRGIITEAQWGWAWRHPWQWLETWQDDLEGGIYRVRARVWQGLDVDTGEEDPHTRWEHAR